MEDRAKDKAIDYAYTIFATGTKRL